MTGYQSALSREAPEAVESLPTARRGSLGAGSDRNRK